MKKLESVLDVLGWTLNSLERAADSQTCPLDKGHLVPRDRLDSHLEKCRLRQRGYSRKEIEALWKYNDEEIRRFFDANGQLNKSLSLSVPAIFTQPQKQPTPESYKSAMPNREKGGVSIQEMAFMRDLKRRRQSYRGIHTAKKSYIEVLREVIEQHTALLNHSADPDQNSSRPCWEDARAEASGRTPDKQSRRSDQFSNSGSDSMRSSERRHSMVVNDAILPCCPFLALPQAEGNKSAHIFLTALATENETDPVAGGGGVRHLHRLASALLVAACRSSKCLCVRVKLYAYLSACHFCMASLCLGACALITCAVQALLSRWFWDLSIA
ncbi:U11/U12 small nuclear ribonucleoprotein 48 kDa protein [Taenia solium]|eukprot:TsM_001034400 transcript=TsM_001034400 gene=TsM_001034400